MTRRVLVVEDDPPTLGYLAMLLQSWGYDVCCAGTATAAVDLIHAKCPSVIISDLILPGMDGVELLRELRIAPKRAGCEVGDPLFILLSGQATVSSAVRAIMEGADEVLVKPLDEMKLLSILQRFEATKLV
jgi:CheY-like chemotaxis protein